MADKNYLPHNFIPGEEPMVKYGTYYRLEPISGATDAHVIKKAFYLPVTDTVNWSFSHEWNEADNLSKNIIDSVESKVPFNLGRSFSKYAQRKIGGSVHVSSCAVYVDSAPPTINVRTKMFSPDGKGQLLRLVELLRQDTHGALGGEAMSQRLGKITGDISELAGSVGGETVGSIAGDAGRIIGSGAMNAVQGVLEKGQDVLNAGGKTFKAGAIDHPEWWKIQVVTFHSAGKTFLATMYDMVCTGMNVTFFAPFYNGEPMMIELDIGFKHAFRGLRESMTFSKGT